MKPKILAYHLPAYHRIPENDKWHGEGFTEWVTTKKGVEFSKNQHQPRIPLNKKYYNLSNIEDLKWQCEIARKYGVDGFCFYHYWFNGKKIFEKPTEQLLKEKNIGIDYCFAWANEEWRNTWSDKLDEPELLLAQDYDNLQDWKNHFDYLLQFFKDDRYIKVDNKPIFLIYHIEDIPEYDKRFSEWNKLAIENGFNGIYLIQMVNNDMSRKLVTNVVDAKVDFEPVRSLASHEKYAIRPWRIRRTFYDKFVKRNLLHNYIFDVVNYNKFCNSLLKKEYTKDKNYYYSAVVDWDNTPRKGKRGWFIKNSTPKSFYEYMKKIYKKTLEEEKQFIFVFAWNEWGEGAYLEPDTRNEYKYLESIDKVVKEL